MQYIRITAEWFDALKRLQTAYKQEIGEDAPTAADLESLRQAVDDGRIQFYGCVDAEKLVACCSVSVVYSTFCYSGSGVFEDFYILPAYRHRGIARALVRYAYEASGVRSMTVGCANCDVEIYRALGFRVPLGNMLAYDG